MVQLPMLMRIVCPCGGCLEMFSAGGIVSTLLLEETLTDSANELEGLLYEHMQKEHDMDYDSAVLLALRSQEYMLSKLNRLTEQDRLELGVDEW